MVKIGTGVSNFVVNFNFTISEITGVPPLLSLGRKSLEIYLECLKEFMHKKSLR